MRSEPQVKSNVYPQGFTVTNGALGPVLCCCECSKQIGYLSDFVTIATLITDARHHIEAEHPECGRLQPYD